MNPSKGTAGRSLVQAVTEVIMHVLLSMKIVLTGSSSVMRG